MRQSDIWGCCSVVMLGGRGRNGFGVGVGVGVGFVSLGGKL